MDPLACFRFPFPFFSLPLSSFPSSFYPLPSCSPPLSPYTSSPLFSSLLLITFLSSLPLYSPLLLFLSFFFFPFFLNQIWFSFQKTAVPANIRTSTLENPLIHMLFEFPTYGNCDIIKVCWPICLTVACLLKKQ